MSGMNICGKAAPYAPSGICTRPVAYPGGPCGIDHQTGAPAPSPSTVQSLTSQASSLVVPGTLDLGQLGRCQNRSVVVQTRYGGMMGTFVYGDEYGVTVETDAGPVEALADDILEIQLVGI